MLVPGLQLFGTALCALRLLSTRTSPVMVSATLLHFVYTGCCCSFGVEGLKITDKLYFDELKLLLLHESNSLKSRRDLSV